MISGLYKEHLKAHPPLTQEEEVALGRKARDGDSRAKDTLFNHNMRLVLHLVKQYPAAMNGISEEDLIQEGNLALMRACNGYDPERDNRFATYAATAIKHAIWKLLNEQKNKNGRNQALNMEEADTPDLEVEAEFAQIEDMETISGKTEKLDDLQRIIVYLYHNENWSFREIGQQLNYSHEWIRNIYIEALDLMNPERKARRVKKAPPANVKSGTVRISQAVESKEEHKANFVGSFYNMFPDLHQFIYPETVVNM